MLYCTAAKMWLIQQPAYAFWGFEMWKMPLMNKCFPKALLACKVQKARVQSWWLTWTVDRGLPELSTRQINTQTSSSVYLPKLHLALPALQCLHILSAINNSFGKNVDLFPKGSELPQYLLWTRLVRFSARPARGSCYQKLLKDLDDRILWRDE